MQIRLIDLPGTRLAVRTLGDASAPPLVLLHGFPQTGALWRRVAERLADRFHLVVPDLRGYGASSHPTDTPDHAGMAKRAMAKDIVDLADALGLGAFGLCGHDRGGRVAHRLAVDHPDRVCRLCVIDIAPTLDMYDRTDMAFARAYHHWFMLIQPAPLPERMIGGMALDYLHATLGGWGQRRSRSHRAGCAGRVRALLLPARQHPQRLRGLPRQCRHRPRPRPRRPRPGPAHRLRCAGAVGRARRGAPLLRPGRAVAGAMQRAGRRLDAAGRSLHSRGTARRDRRGTGRLLRPLTPPPPPRR